MIDTRKEKIKPISEPLDINEDGMHRGLAVLSELSMSDAAAVAHYFGMELAFSVAGVKLVQEPKEGKRGQKNKRRNR